MKIEFKRPEIEDRDLINSFLKEEESRNCEMVFANIYLWSRTVYPVKYAIIEDTICFLSEGQEKSVTFPVGKGDKKKVIRILKEEWEKNGEEFRMHLIKKEQFEVYTDCMEKRY